MAHFLEHLVFKGGEKYPTYRDVNEAAERIGAVLNAYTSHDLVAFHITARAERALEAADLLTDFVGRPRIDAEELDRERGVVVQEIARADDQPAAMAEHLIDEAVFGEHPLGRPVLGPTEHIRDTFTREGDRRLPHPPLVARRPAPRSWSATSSGAGDDGALDELFGRFAERAASPRPTSPRPPLAAARAGPRARLQPVAPADVLPARRSTSPTRASAPRWRSTRRCSAARWARGCSTRSASSAGSPIPSAPFPHAYADVPVLQLSAGLESAKCVEAYQRMREIVTELRERRPDRGRGRARPRLRRRRPHDRVREHRRGRPLRRPADDRLRQRRRRSRLDDRAARRGHLRRGARRSPPASPTSCRSPASARTRWRSWKPPETLDRRRRGARDRGGGDHAGRPRILQPHQPAPTSSSPRVTGARSPGRRARPAARRRASTGTGPDPARRRASPPSQHCARRSTKPAAARRARTAARWSTTSTPASSCTRCRDQVKRPPASVEKLYTTVALMRILGPGARLHTDVLGTGSLSARRLARQPVPARRRRPDVRRSRPSTASGSTATARPPPSSSPSCSARGSAGSPARCIADESLFDRRRGGLITNYAPDTPDFGGQLSALTYDHGSDTDQALARRSSRSSSWR